MVHTDTDLGAFVSARWEEVREANAKGTQALLLQLAQRAREEYPTATGIRLGDSDQGDYMTYNGMLDANGDDLDEDCEFDDDGDCSAFDETNSDTWGPFCIEGPQHSHRRNNDWVIQIDQVLAAGSTLIEPPKTIDAVEKFLSGETDDDTRARVLEAAQAAANAAEGDSNDAEIEALQNALEVALGALGLTMPEADDGHEFQPPAPGLTDEKGQPLDPNECGECGEHHDEPDGAPCCPDPDCGGRGSTNGCTFPGYADNH